MVRRSFSIDIDCIKWKGEETQIDKLTCYPQGAQRDSQLDIDTSYGAQCRKTVTRQSEAHVLLSLTSFTRFSKLSGSLDAVALEVVEEL